MSRPRSYDVTIIAAAPDALPDAAGAVVYRAVRSDAPFPYVCIGPGDGYDVVHEDGTPDGSTGVVAIELFVVPAGQDEGFLAAWAEERDDRTGRRGYLGSRLFRATAEAEYRFVELARWSSPLMIHRAGIRKPLLFVPVRD